MDLRLRYFKRILFSSALVCTLLLLWYQPAAATVTYKIKKGDTLEKIGKKYSISINELKKLNNIKNVRALKIGAILIIDPEPRSYTVAEGDTTETIASRFKVNPYVLLAINGLDGDEAPAAGTKLFVESPLPRTEATRRIQEDISARLEKKLSEDSELSLPKRLLAAAELMMNVPYKFGGTTFAGIDCSAYVQKVFSFVDILIPRSAREQFKVGQPVAKSSLAEGDLVFFRTYARFPSHVGIYLGDNLFIHASAKTRSVSIENLSLPYYAKRYIGARRMIAAEFLPRIGMEQVPSVIAR
jgi:peptidoglycan DL-endopeptidase LytE